MSASKTTGFWSEEDKKRWINKAIVRACNFARWKFLRKPSTINTEKDKEAYYLPFDYKSMISLKVDGEIYHPTDPEDYQSGNYAWEKANYPEFIIVHHSATARDTTQFETIKNNHIGYGWGDIGYHKWIAGAEPSSVYKGRAISSRQL